MSSKKGKFVFIFIISYNNNNNYYYYHYYWKLHCIFCFFLFTITSIVNIAVNTAGRGKFELANQDLAGEKF